MFKDWSTGFHDKLSCVDLPDISPHKVEITLIRLITYFYL